MGHDPRWKEEFRELIRVASPGVCRSLCHWRGQVRCRDRLGGLSCSLPRGLSNLSSSEKQPSRKGVSHRLVDGFAVADMVSRVPATVSPNVRGRIIGSSHPPSARLRSVWRTRATTVTLLPQGLWECRAIGVPSAEGPMSAAVPWRGISAGAHPLRFGPKRSRQWPAPARDRICVCRTCAETTAPPSGG